MITERKFICTVCPIGCELTARFDDANLSHDKIEVSGNTCKRGENYAKTELIDPVRTLTSIVRTDSDEFPMLPVKTSSPIPKDTLFDAMDVINKLKVHIPIKNGDILYKDFIIEGVNLVACRSIN